MDRIIHLMHSFPEKHSFASSAVVGVLLRLLVGIDDLLSLRCPAQHGILVELLAGVLASGLCQELHRLHGVARLDGGVTHTGGLGSDFRSILMEFH